MIDDGIDPLADMITFGNFLHGSYDTVEGWRSRLGVPMQAFVGEDYGDLYVNAAKTDIGHGFALVNFGMPELVTPQEEIDRGYEWVNFARLFSRSKIYSIKGTKGFRQDGWPYRAPDGQIWHMQAYWETSTTAKVYALRLVPSMLQPRAAGTLIATITVPDVTYATSAESTTDIFYDVTFDPTSGAHATAHLYTATVGHNYNEMKNDVLLYAIEMSVTGGDILPDDTLNPLVVTSTVTTYASLSVRPAAAILREVVYSRSAAENMPTFDFIPLPYPYYTVTSNPPGQYPIPTTQPITSGSSYYPSEDVAFNIATIGIGYKSDGTRVVIGHGNRQITTTSVSVHDLDSLVVNQVVQEFSGPTYKWTGGGTPWIESSDARISAVGRTIFRTGFFHDDTMLPGYAEIDETYTTNSYNPTRPNQTEHTAFVANNKYTTHDLGSGYIPRYYATYAVPSGWPALDSTEQMAVRYVYRTGHCTFSFGTTVAKSFQYSGGPWQTPPIWLRGVVYQTANAEFAVNCGTPTLFEATGPMAGPMPSPEDGSLLRTTMFYF